MISLRKLYKQYIDLLPTMKVDSEVQSKGVEIVSGSEYSFC